VKDRQRCSYLHRSEHIEQPWRRKNRGRSTVGLGGTATARRLDTDTTAEGTEARQIRFATGSDFVRSLHLITVNDAAKSEQPMRHQRAWHGWNLQCLDGDDLEADWTFIDPGGGR
jgi:hypothetical protein